MSWIRSAMHKAAEAPGGAMFRAAVRTYADAVVQQAGFSVSEAAKMFQDRIAPQTIKSFSDAATRLEEASVTCKGEERVQLLRRWLVALKEFKRLNGRLVENDGKCSEDPHMLSNENVTPGNPIMISYYDPDLGSSPMNFCDVFLQSQALEGMTMSMILGAPNEEEILLLHEIFGLCLTGGREVHDVVVRNIQDLAKAFSVYDVEMLVRREELLQFAQTAITGLKITADVTRIDSEISQIQQSLDRMKFQKSSSSSMDTEESVAHIQLCCRLKSLLLKKKLVKKGDTPETHAQKVDKLKVLLESLHNSAYKTDKRILEHREQKKEIITFRVARNSEVSQIEKDLEAEISVIEKQRDKLEAELREVNSTLVAAITRLQNVREERLQFDEDNDEFLLHLKEKEDELSKTAVSYRAEADTCNAFINFLEATWAFQSTVVQQRDKQVNDQLQNHEAYFVNAFTSILSSCKDQLEHAIADFRKLLQSLKGFQYIIDPDEEFLQDIKQRENLEQEYLDAEAKVINIFDAVDSIKEQFYSSIDDDNVKGVEMINELCSDIEKIKRDFKIIKRPILRIEIPTNEELSPATRSPQGAMIHSPGRVIHDFKSIFSQNLLVKSPRQKPYIPLGESSENSPVSSMENHFKSTEKKQHKMKAWESETPSYYDEHVSIVAKTDTREQLMASECQESKMHDNSTLELDKELVKPVLDKGTCMNSKTIEDGQRKTLQAASTGNDADLSKSTSVLEEQGEVSTEVAGWEFDELVNELKDDDYHHKKGKNLPCERVGFDRK